MSQKRSKIIDETEDKCEDGFNSSTSKKQRIEMTLEEVIIIFYF